MKIILYGVICTAITLALAAVYTQVMPNIFPDVQKVNFLQIYGTMALVDLLFFCAKKVKRKD